jgi:acyl dehydratase
MARRGGKQVNNPDFATVLRAAAETARRSISRAPHRKGMQIMRGLYWEEWEIGQEFVSPARTVTEADIVMFAGLSGDYNPLHINEEYCKQTQFGTRIAHGPLIYAIAAGLVFQLHLYDDTLIAFLGFDSLKFTKPTKIGDTVHVKLKVLEKRETSNPDRGVMKRQLQVLNQRGRWCRKAASVLLKRKPSFVIGRAPLVGSTCIPSNVPGSPFDSRGYEWVLAVSCLHNAGSSRRCDLALLQALGCSTSIWKIAFQRVLMRDVIGRQAGDRNIEVDRIDD